MDSWSGQRCHLLAGFSHRKSSSTLFIIFLTTRLPFIIQKRLLNSVRTCSTPEPWPSFSCSTITTSCDTTWFFGNKIGCLVSYEGSPACLKRPSILRTPSLSVLDSAAEDILLALPSGRLLIELALPRTSLLPIPLLMKAFCQVFVIPLGVYSFWQTV